MKERFAEAKLILDDVDDAFQRLKRKQSNKCSWNDKEDVNLYKRDMEYKARERRLNRLVPSRVCPCCGELKPGRRQWVIKRGKAICRSCYHAQGGNKVKGIRLDLVELFDVDAMAVKGQRLGELRVMAKVSRNHFAKRTGISFDALQRIEHAEWAKVRRSTAEGLLRALEKSGIIVQGKLPWK